MPGSTPASVSPSKKRSASKLRSFQMNAVTVATAPHAMSNMPSQAFAPKRNKARLLGICGIMYPTKNTLAPKPKTAGLKPRSWFICRPAKPRLMRSR